MKIAVLGGSGLIGSKLVRGLRQLGHTVLAASPQSGVNTITGEGLKEALRAAAVVADVSNAPSLEEGAVLEFFRTSTANLLQAETAAGVQHHVALSVVGTERLQDSGYFRAKLAQEELVKKSGTPYSILRSTQFFEFAAGIANASTIGQEVRMSTGAVQPIAADDVVRELADIATGPPLNTTVEVAGPVRMPMSEFIRYYLKATNDARQVVADAHALYFGTELNAESLVPGKNPRLGKIRYEDWLSTQFIKQ